MARAGSVCGILYQVWALVLKVRIRQDPSLARQQAYCLPVIQESQLSGLALQQCAIDLSSAWQLPTKTLYKLRQPCASLQRVYHRGFCSITNQAACVTAVIVVNTGQAVIVWQLVLFSCSSSSICKTCIKSTELP